MTYDPNMWNTYVLTEMFVTFPFPISGLGWLDELLQLIKKTSSFIEETTFSYAKRIWNFYISTSVGAVRQG